MTERPDDQDAPEPEEAETEAPAGEEPNAPDEAAVEEPAADEPVAETPEPEPAAEAPEAAEPDAESPEPEPESPEPEPESPEPEPEPPEPEPEPETPEPEPEAEPPGGPEPETTPEQAQAATDETVAAADQTVDATGDTAAEEPTAETAAAEATSPAAEDFIEETPREKPAIPGAHLEVDIVPEGSDPLGREAALAEGAEYEVADSEPAVEAEQPAGEPDPDAEVQTRAEAIIDLGADARYRATGKRKTAVARVILRPGEGRYMINGRPLDEHFPRPALQRNIRQPLETVGYEARMDVTASLHGGGVSSQAGALRHGISRALIEADPNLRGELKRRGFLTRDPRVKERKKAGLKKARKRPQFSKR